VSCDDCHTPATTAGGTRYSIHDHLFDFSQPAVDCRECHDEGDERLAQTPTHEWNIRPVRFPEKLTMAQACARCHEDKGQDWVAEKLQGLKKRL